MSELGDLDSVVLRSVSNPPLSTKGSDLTFTELDNHAVKLYDAVQAIVSGENVTAYDAGTTYDMFSTDVNQQFASYNSRIWKAVYVGSPSTFSGQTPEEGIYWEQVSLAQLMPNILKIAEIGNDTTSALVKLHSQNVNSADVLHLHSTPIAMTIARSSGENISPIFPIVGSVVFDSVAYDTNTTLGLRFVGADEPIATCDILGRTASGSANFVPVTSVGLSDTQYIIDADLELYVESGEPLNGDSTINVSFHYSKWS